MLLPAAGERGDDPLTCLLGHGEPKLAWVELSLAVWQGYMLAKLPNCEEEGQN